MKKLVSAVLAASLLATTVTTVAANPTEPGREVLGPTNGWAAANGGTTGGAEADTEHIYTVTNKAELLAALDNKSSEPKIIYVTGTIDINVDENGNPVGPDYYADPEYDLQAYLEAYHPDNWGYEEEVYGPLEDARNRSQNKQKNAIAINIGSNTSIIGLGDDAKITGGSLNLDKVENIIIRNLEIESPVDYFPGWDPTDDNNTGNWNSEYDALVVKDGTENVWIDHNTLTDGDYPDSEAPEYFGKTYQQHDGLIDVVNEANYVTISYNVIEEHDKTMLIGNSDNKTGDRDHLKVTIHHNYFKDVTQRLPRVRYGEVHVYNNLFEITEDSDYGFSYAFGVGVGSKTYVENNYFAGDIDPAKIIRNWRGTSIFERGSIVANYHPHARVDLVAAHNEANPDALLDEDVGWKPKYYEKIDPTQFVPDIVKEKAGSGVLPFK